MFNKFKNGEIVIVNGVGKNQGKRYIYRIAKVISRDSYYLDYNVQFENGTEDWVDEKYLIKI